MREPAFDEQDTLSEDLLASFTRSAFRLETRSSYVLGYEEVEYQRFVAGCPTPPPDVRWWRPWLDRIAGLTSEGKAISRVRIVDNPPSDYQRWELWAAPWHEQAGERIAYLPRASAIRLALPVTEDWWLLDDERLLLMSYDDNGRMLDPVWCTDPEKVAQHRMWRDLAVHHATTAENITAA